VPAGYHKVGSDYFFVSPDLGSYFKVTNSQQIQLLNSGALKSINSSTGTLSGLKNTTTGTTPTTPTTKEPGDTTDGGESTPYVAADDGPLRSSAEFKALSRDEQDAVLAVFNAIAANDVAQANRLVTSFKAATKMNDPFFAEQLKLAVDAIERGYVEIDKEAEYKEMQIKTRLQDLKKDYEVKKDYLSLEQASVLRGIERQYETDLEDTRQNLAAGGFSSSSRRIKKEQYLEEATGDLRESTNRKFAFDQGNEDRMFTRSERDTQRELARLTEITNAGKLDFLRNAEKQVGSKSLPKLDGSYSPLGNIFGEIARNKMEDTLSAATSFVF